ncbi:MAG: hypothetical protein LC798_21915 [Chloroflexi bacterium]|nr:hypothetical protein [Chloroflexota bacterium]
MTRAIERSRSHQYTMHDGSRQYGPFPGATAITGLQDSLGGSDGLLTWAVNLALDEVRTGLPMLQALGRSDDQEAGWSALRERALQAKGRARDLGTAIHAVCDQINRGMTPQMFTDGVAPYVAQYGAALYQKGIRVLGSERYVVNTTIGFGGTYDSLVEIDGERGPLDVKSGKEKPSMRLQLTGLSMGEWHGEDGLEAEPMPELSGVGFILLLRPDGYQLVRHEITESDQRHFIRLVETYHEIRRWAAEFAPSTLKEAA